MKLLILSLLIVLTTSAQDAIVVDLSAVDSATIKALYERKAEVDRQIESARARIGRVYATWAHIGFTGTDGGSVLNGVVAALTPAFEFSTDFKHIVPKTIEQSDLAQVLRGCGSPFIQLPAGMPSITTQPASTNLHYGPWVNDGLWTF